MSGSRPGLAASPTSAARQIRWSGLAARPPPRFSENGPWRVISACAHGAASICCRQMTELGPTHLNACCVMAGHAQDVDAGRSTAAIPPGR